MASTATMLSAMLSANGTNHPAQDEDYSSGEEGEDQPPPPSCTGRLKRGLGPLCKAPSIAFDGYNIHRCGRHRICHGQVISTGIKCQKYVYKGNTLCTACQENRQGLKILTVQSEEEVVQVMDIGDHEDNEKRQKPQNKQEKRIREAPKSASNTRSLPVPSVKPEETATPSIAKSLRRSPRLEADKNTKTAAKATKSKAKGSAEHLPIAHAADPALSSTSAPDPTRTLAKIPAAADSIKWTHDPGNSPRIRSSVTLTTVPTSPSGSSSAAAAPGKRGGKPETKMSSVAAPPSSLGQGPSSSSQDKGKGKGKGQSPPAVKTPANAADKNGKNTKAKAKEPAVQDILAQIASLQRWLEAKSAGASVEHEAVEMGSAVVEDGKGQTGEEDDHEGREEEKNDEDELSNLLLLSL